MARLNRTGDGAAISRIVFVTILIAVAVYALLIINGAAAVRSQNLQVKVISFGPLRLYEMSRAQQDGGYLVSMRVLTGTFQYIFLTLCVALICAGWRLRKLHRKSA